MRLRTSSTPIAYSCPIKSKTSSRITDRAVRTLALHCSRLRYIDLACCSLLTDLSVFELAHLQKLRRVGLVRVSNLTDEGVLALSARHNTLERIHLSYCENISVQAVHVLLTRLNKLTHLSLTGIPSFRREELQKFCRPPPRVCSLSLPYECFLIFILRSSILPRELLSVSTPDRVSMLFVDILNHSLRTCEKMST